MSQSTVFRFAAALAAGGPPIVGYVNGRAVRAVMGADDNGTQQAQGAGQGQQGGQQPPERPDGVSEAEWAALGDPGKAAIVRERQRAAAAEQALAALRQQQPGSGQASGAGQQSGASSGQSGQQQAPGDRPGQQQAADKGTQPDVAALVTAAVSQALAPLIQRDQQREVEAATQRIRDGVLAAAKDRLVDPTDALANLDLPTLTDGAGGLDSSKLSAALDGLVQRKPHLARVVDDRRFPGPGSPHGGASGVTGSLDDQVKAQLAAMNAALGISTPPKP